MKTYTYQGKIWSGEQGENYNALFIGYNSHPLAERVNEDFGWGDKQVTVRYWITETEKKREELIENEILKKVGSLEAEYRDRYSELTGYLWTDENLVVGGHDLLNEIRSYEGKFLYLEIDVL